MDANRRPSDRIIIVLAAATLIAAGGSASAAGDAARGEEAYAATCSECHASAARIAQRIEGDTPEEKQAWLEGFLPEHYAPDEALRGDLSTFLLTQ